MNRENIIEITLGEVVAIITTAAQGLKVKDRKAADAMQGCARALFKKRKEITQNIIEKLEG